MHRREIIVNVSTFLLSITSLIAQSAQANLQYSHDAQCNKAIKEVEHDISVSRKGRVAYIGDFKHEQTESSEGSPFQQKIGINFSLGSGRNSDEKATASQHNANEKILDSPNLLNKYAHKIIGTCREVVRVDFCQAWTDCIISYSYMRNNKIQKDTCVTGSNTYKKRWGERSCF